MNAPVTEVRADPQPPGLPLRAGVFTVPSDLVTWPGALPYPELRRSRRRRHAPGPRRRRPSRRRGAPRPPPPPSCAWWSRRRRGVAPAERDVPPGIGRRESSRVSGLPPGELGQRFDGALVLPDESGAGDAPAHGQRRLHLVKLRADVGQELGHPHHPRAVLLNQRWFNLCGALAPWCASFSVCHAAMWSRPTYTRLSATGASGPATTREDIVAVDAAQVSPRVDTLKRWRHDSHTEARLGPVRRLTRWSSRSTGSRRLTRVKVLALTVCPSTHDRGFAAPCGRRRGHQIASSIPGKKRHDARCDRSRGAGSVGDHAGVVRRPRETAESGEWACRDRWAAARRRHAQHRGCRCRSHSEFPVAATRWQGIHRFLAMRRYRRRPHKSSFGRILLRSCAFTAASSLPRRREGHSYLDANRAPRRPAGTSDTLAAKHRCGLEIHLLRTENRSHPIGD